MLYCSHAKIDRTILCCGLFFAADFSAKAQCDDGEVLVEFIVDTDAWAYEMYWELVPGGVECGVGESLMSGG